MKERRWKKNRKGPTTSTNYLEVLVDDENATLAKFNQLRGIKNNVFFGTRVPRRKNPMVTLEVEEMKEDLHRRMLQHQGNSEMK
jgi:hypothetical protein